MIALTFTTKTAIINMNEVPEQWRNNIDVQPILSLQQPMRFRYVIQIQPDDSSYRYRALMQKPQLVLKFSLPFYVEFPVGTYMTWQNQRFALMRAQDLKKQGTRKIEYTMTLGTNEDYFGMWKLRNVVDAVEQGEDAPKDNRLKFALCAKPHEFIDLIVRNLNKKDTSVTWERGECIEASEKTVEFNHSYIDAALSDIANTFNTEYEVEYYGTTNVHARIHLRRVEYNNNTEEAVKLAYGVGNGFVPGVGRTSEADGVPVKRMFTQGTDRNIDRSKYGSPELLMPKSQSIWFDGTNFYYDGDENIPASARKYQSDENGESVERKVPTSDATKEDSLDCSEIYPSRYGEVTDVRVVNADKNFYDIVDSTIPDNLNFNDYLIAGETMTLIMQDGMLAGKEFDVKYVHKEVVNGTSVYAKRFEIVPQEIDGVVMPNATFCPVANGQKPQHYAIFGIQLPDEYICNNEDHSGASWDMMRAAVRELYKAEDQRFTFTGTLQALYAKKHWIDIGGKLIVGGHVLFTDNQFAKDGVLIRIVGIKDYLTAPYSPTIELSNSVSASGASVSSQLRQIDNTEVIIEDARKTAIQYTKRRFRDALQTIGMLEDAHIGDFSGSVSPVAVQTMAMLVGDESLQFRFARKIETVENGETIISYASTESPIGYDNERKQLVANMSNGGYDICLQHMTLGQHAIMTQARRDTSEYPTWAMQSYTSPVLDEPARSYYLYARVSGTDTEAVGSFVLSPTAKSIDCEAGYYHLLCGVLNSEIEGARSYVSLYGFTEILPGRITTDMIISNDGNTYFDLANNEIGGAIKFLSDNGYITIIDGGYIKTELINAAELVANHIIAGEPDGQRVEITPNNKAVEIYDTDGVLCSIFEGNSYLGLSSLYSGTHGANNVPMAKRTTADFGYSKDVTYARGQIEQIVGNNLVGETTQTHHLNISEAWQTTTPTEVNVSGHVYLRAYSELEKSQASQGIMPISKASISFELRLNTYADASCQELTQSHVVASYRAAADAQSKINSSQIDTNIYTDVDTISESFAMITKTNAGWHRLEITTEQHVSGKNNRCLGSWGATELGRNDIAATYKSDFYVSRYFANGFCLGTRADNYILAYKDSANSMVFQSEVNGVGVQLSSDGLRIKHHNRWGKIPHFVFKGTIYCGTNYASLSDVTTFDGTSASEFTLTRTERGEVSLKFPEKWRIGTYSLGINSNSDAIVQLTGRGVMKGSLVSLSSSGVLISISDDDTTNDNSMCDITLWTLY